MAVSKFANNLMYFGNNKWLIANNNDNLNVISDN
jgi:hypothetical protein